MVNSVSQVSGDPDVQEIPNPATGGHFVDPSRRQGPLPCSNLTSSISQSSNRIDAAPSLSTSESATVPVGVASSSTVQSTPTRAPVSASANTQNYSSCSSSERAARERLIQEALERSQRELERVNAVSTRLTVCGKERAYRDKQKNLLGVFITAARILEVPDRLRSKCDCSNSNAMQEEEPATASGDQMQMRYLVCSNGRGGGPRITRCHLDVPDGNFDLVAPWTQDKDIFASEYIDLLIDGGFSGSLDGSFQACRKQGEWKDEWLG